MIAVILILGLAYLGATAEPGGTFYHQEAKYVVDNQCEKPWMTYEDTIRYCEKDEEKKALYLSVLKETQKDIRAEKKSKKAQAIKVEIEPDYPIGD